MPGRQENRCPKGPRDSHCWGLHRHSRSRAYCRFEDFTVATVSAEPPVVSDDGRRALAQGDRGPLLLNLGSGPPSIVYPREQRLAYFAADNTRYQGKVIFSPGGVHVLAASVAD